MQNDTNHLTGTVTKSSTSYAVHDGSTSYSYARATDSRKWLVTLSNGRTARFSTKQAAQAWLDMKLAGK